MASINSPRGGITLMIPRHGTLRRDPAARSFKVWNIASYALDLHSMSLFVRRSFKQTSKETRLFPWTHLPSSFFQHFGPFPRSFIISHLRFFLFFFFLSNTFLSVGVYFVIDLWETIVVTKLFTEITHHGLLLFDPYHFVTQYVTVLDTFSAYTAANRREQMVETQGNLTMISRDVSCTGAGNSNWKAWPAGDQFYGLSRCASETRQTCSLTLGRIFPSNVGHCKTSRCWALTAGEHIVWSRKQGNASFRREKKKKGK